MKTAKSEKLRTWAANIGSIGCILVVVVVGRLVVHEFGFWGGVAMAGACCIIIGVAIDRVAADEEQR